MAGFSPRFCAIHLKIHMCPDASVTTKLKQQEDSIGYKIRRLHGNQTEEDKEADQDKLKRTTKEGSITALLAKAKATNAKQREDTGINDDDMEHGPLVTEDNINDRMAKLRNKALGIVEPKAKTISEPDISGDEVVTKAVKKTPKSSLSDSIEKARSSQHEEKYGHIEKTSQVDDTEDEYDDDLDNEMPTYTETEVSHMITSAVELALSKFIKSNAKKSSPAKKPVSKKTAIIKPPVKKPVAKKVVAKPAAKSPAKKVVAKKPIKKK
ncbi:hypothetical protein [Spiroplasma endosymbiont of Othius punctulatus]|uniref:hypothetical protein n=1 Tax=Spiroplasma endosymbiont of Othius punctulatus TaxID=3066289 RepID=UPI0030D5D5E0